MYVILIRNVTTSPTIDRLQLRMFLSLRFAVVSYKILFFTEIYENRTLSKFNPVGSVRSSFRVIESQEKCNAHLLTVQ